VSLNESTMKAKKKFNIGKFLADFSIGIIGFSLFGVAILFPIAMMFKTLNEWWLLCYALYGAIAFAISEQEEKLKI
jgi:hypothetical protein